VTVTLTYKDFPQLAVKNPYLWWPTGYGEQYLHNLELSYEHNGKVSSTKNTVFGIREVTSKLKEISGNYGMVFMINGKRVYCKGGWTQPDMLLDLSKKRLYDEARLLVNANMNMIGTEDMPSPTEEFVDACDKYGIMLWETFYQCWTSVPGTYTAYYPLDHFLAIKNARDMILRYRNNASLVVWCAENENVPGPDLYFALRDDLKELDTTRPFIPTSSTLWDWEKLTPYIKNEMPVGVTDIGAPGYTWHPSAYFFDKINEVKLQMFRDELGIPAVPTLSSLKKFVFNAGKDKENAIFPLDSVWAEHGVWDGNGYNYKAYDVAIRNIYGFKSKSIEEYVHVAQIVNAEGYRAMFEAASSRMWDITSGVMLWKLNSSAPDLVWNIYDWFLNPHAGYYYTKKACEPLHIQLNANDSQVSVINTYHKAINNLKVRVRVYDFNMKTRWEREEKLNIGEDRYQEMFRVPQLSDITPVYFVKLELIDGNGKVVSDNFYWESSKETPDFSDLAKLENVKLDFTSKSEETKGEYIVVVKVKNTTNKLSFLNRLAVIKSNNEEVLPTIWNDNFITLLPGEEKTVEARFSKNDLNGLGFTIVIDNNR
jgi:exo-1,4-beta-D-glucosaminidase